MATPPKTTMLREISAAGDRERTGAFDVEWDGAQVTLFFMFGHPSHVVFEASDGRNLVGEPALDAFVAELPAEFRVAPWRRAMVTDDTLHCTAEDLMGLFQRRNAAVESNGHEAEAPAAPLSEGSPASAAAPPVPLSPPPASAQQPPFGLSDFPVLPLATTLWTDAAANVINLEAAVPRLPDSFIVLAGPTCQGAALIAGGRVTDAVWVNAAGGCLGDDAAHALMNSLEGTLTAYRVDDPRIADALPMLWRAPRLGAGLPGGWLHTEDVVAEVRTSARSCCLVVDSDDPGVALFAAGELVAVYTLGHRWPATSMAALRSLLHEPGARLTVLGDVTGAPPHAEVPEPPAPESVESDGPTAEAVGEAPSDAAPEVEVAPEAVAEALVATAAVEATESTVEAAAADADATEEAADDPGVTASTTAVEAPAEPQPKGRGRRGRNKADRESDHAASTETAEAADPPGTSDVELAPEATAVDEIVVTLPTGTEDDATSATEEPVPPAADDLQFETAPRPVSDVRFEPAVFTIADLAAERTSAEQPSDPTGMADVEAREATEFVPARLDIDVDALRTELTDIATVWLGEDDAAPVARAIGAARPGVDDFVSAIRAIGAMEIPGHESAVVRAMAREMHFRASEVLCGV